jgi:acyl-CoA dehydrogenase
MDFDFSDEQKMFRDQLARQLRDICPMKSVHSALDGDKAIAARIYAELAEVGALGVAIPERYGGLGLGALELCVVAEQVGRVLAPAPVGSTLYLFADLLQGASEEQKRRILPRIANGSLAATVGFAEAPGSVFGAQDRCTLVDGRLRGEKLAVLDGMTAQLALISAVAAGGTSVLALVDLSAAGVERLDTLSLDPSRPLATLRFNGAAAEQVGDSGAGRRLLEQTLTRAAVLFAFEQVAGAEAAVDMAVDYAKQRQAFGRPIGSFQAIKHKLADCYVDNVLARSNAYYAAWALAADDPELTLAAATARISATEAFDHASREMLQTYGGIGFTWEADCHLFYRRAQHLGRIIGGESEWSERVAAYLEAQLPTVNIDRIFRPAESRGA